MPAPPGIHETFRREATEAIPTEARLPPGPTAHHTSGPTSVNGILSDAVASLYPYPARTGGRNYATCAAT